MRTGRDWWSRSRMAILSRTMEATTVRPKDDAPILRPRSDYRLIASVYDGLALAYSGGAIPAARRWAVRQVPPGGRVLFAGCGSATDAVGAARSGARVTAIDSAQAMVTLARRKLRRAGVADLLEILHGDVFDLNPAAGYDAVVASCFLNVFATGRLPWVVSRLARLLRPGGRLIVTDFAGGTPGAAPRLARRLYHDLPMHIFARLGANDAHPLHDIAGTLGQTGLRIEARRRFRLLAVGPAWWEGLVAVRPSG